MKLIGLLRHAKSDWDTPFITDKERGLSNRGIRNASSLRKFLRIRSLSFDAALVSDAKRAQDTLRLINKSNVLTENVNILEELYDAEKDTYLQNIHKLPDVFEKVLIIGHNPEIESICSFLMGLDKSPFSKFSTSSLALLQFETNDWTHIPDVKGTLSLYWNPSKRT